LVGMMPSELPGFLSQLIVIRRSQVTLSRPGGSPSSPKDTPQGWV
jgi:hypothetical protein